MLIFVCHRYLIPKPIPPLNECKMSMLVCSFLVFADCFTMLSYTFGMGTAFIDLYWLCTRTSQEKSSRRNHV